MTIAAPGFLLASWGLGLHLAAALVAITYDAQRGFYRLAGGVAAIVSLGAGLLGAGAAAYIAAACGFAVALLARRQWVVGFGALGIIASFPVLTGGLWLGVIGGIGMGLTTGLMLIGHWFLVDPKIPRRPLRIIGLTATAGVAALLAAGAVAGVFAAEGPFALAGPVLLGFSVVLLAAAVAALRQPGYPAVLAMTGLSYLAVVTVLGGVFGLNTALASLAG